MNRQKGLIGIIVLIIIALALLKYFFNWSVFDAAASPQGNATIRYVRELFNTAWSYIEGPVLFVWHQIIWPILGFAWKSFQSLIHSNGVPNINISAPGN